MEIVRTKSPRARVALSSFEQVPLAAEDNWTYDSQPLLTDGQHQL